MAENEYRNQNDQRTGTNNIITLDLTNKDFSKKITSRQLLDMKNVSVYMTFAGCTGISGDIAVQETVHVRGAGAVDFATPLTITSTATGTVVIQNAPLAFEYLVLDLSALTLPAVGTIKIFIVAKR